MAYLVVLLIAVAVVVLVMRAASASGGPDGGRGLPRPPRPQGPKRVVAPDDDPDFLRELERRTRRDDGSPT